MKITLNHQELDFKFKYSELAILESEYNLDLGQLEEFTKKLSNASIIGAIGLGKPIEEVKQLLDEGTFDDAKEIVRAFTHEIKPWIIPNSQSQTN